MQAVLACPGRSSDPDDVGGNGDAVGGAADCDDEHRGPDAVNDDIVVHFR